MRGDNVYRYGNMVVHVEPFLSGSILSNTLLRLVTTGAKHEENHRNTYRACARLVWKPEIPKLQTGAIELAPPI